jgi:hypothetical protein
MPFSKYDLLPSQLTPLVSNLVKIGVFGELAIYKDVFSAMI